ncbi:MAG: maleylpyruvate isomerase N-terminal domain-containing protein, partial [Acidobacteriota bacterium]
MLALLRSLTASDWEKPTLAPVWQVRDVAAHILDSDLRKLSAYRDGFVPRPDGDISTFEGLTAFLNELNATWTQAARRLSPRVLIDLLGLSGPAVAELLRSLPPNGTSLFPVSWAGESRSENWLDVGREYTERWHHQMQIRIAVGADPLLQRRWAHPVFDLSMRALPRAWAEVSAPDGAA